jgi:hypothetical protein
VALKLVPTELSAGLGAFHIGLPGQIVLIIEDALLDGVPTGALTLCLLGPARRGKEEKNNGPEMKWKYIPALFLTCSWQEGVLPFAGFKCC